MKKMNMVDKFSAIKAMLNGEQVKDFSLADALEFLDGRIEQVNKKNASGNAKTQLENEGIKEQIAQFLRSADKPMTIGDIGKAVGIDSNQKISALVIQMVKCGKAERSEVKGKAYFAIAK